MNETEATTLHPLSIAEELRDGYYCIWANFRCPRCKHIFTVNVNIPAYVSEEQEVKIDKPIECSHCGVAGEFSMKANVQPPIYTGVQGESSGESTALHIDSNGLNECGWGEIT